MVQEYPRCSRHARAAKSSTSSTKATFAFPLSTSNHSANVKHEIHGTYPRRKPLLTFQNLRNRKITRLPIIIRENVEENYTIKREIFTYSLFRNRIIAQHRPAVSLRFDFNC